MEQMRETKRKYWTPEEDIKLMEYVNTHGPGNWKKAAKTIGIGKNRSCSQRYNNHLSPELVHGEFTGEEKDKIEMLRAIWGNKWALIASHLPAGRTANSVKNWYHKKVAKEARAQKQALATAAAPPQHPPPDPTGGDGFGDYILNSGGHGAQFGDYILNSGAQFGDYILNSGGGGGSGSVSGGAQFWDYNEHFLNSDGASSSTGAVFDDQFLSYWPTTAGPADNHPPGCCCSFCLI